MKSSSKSLHKYIHNKKVGVPSVGPLKLDNGDLIADCGKMAELLATSFCQAYCSHELPAPFPHQVSDASIITVPVSIEDVRNRLAFLDPDSSMGPDGLHPCLLKSCPSLTIPLHMIFRQSVAQGKLPVEWKRSEIIPIFKKESRHVPPNYRPISLTSICCKTLERIIVQALYDFLEANQLLSNDQFGFRRDRTVDDQLLIVYNDVSLWVDSGYVVDIVLFDFSKVFDIVSHAVLIDKLTAGGRWFFAWLDIRLLNWSYYEGSSVWCPELL